MDDRGNVLWLESSGFRRLTHCEFVFADGRESVADRYLERHGVRYTPKLVFSLKDERRYVLIAGRIHRRKLAAFEEAMREMRRDMPLLGYRDYDGFCSRAFKMLEEEKRKRHPGRSGRNARQLRMSLGK